MYVLICFGNDHVICYSGPLSDKSVGSNALYKGGHIWVRAQDTGEDRTVNAQIRQLVKVAIFIFIMFVNMFNQTAAQIRQQVATKKVS